MRHGASLQDWSTGLAGGPASGLISTHLVTLICCLQVSALQRLRPVAAAIGTCAERIEAVGGSCERVTHESWLYEFMTRLITTTAADSGYQLAA